MIELPSKARVVIIGGGISGCSVAYHLAKLGWTDIILLERKQLTSGTTWHAAGLVGQLRASQNMTRLAKYSADLYTRLEAETGLATGLRQCGSITVALTEERREEIFRQAALARAFGVDVNELSPAEVLEHYPHLNISDVVAGVHLPLDGQADPGNIALALAKGARMNGARIIEQVKVTRITTAEGRVTGVDWEANGEKGHIATENVVNCGGMWGRDLAAQNDVALPLHACEHFYIVTENVPGLSQLPVLRVPDECAYYKEDAGKILLGAFEPKAKPWALWAGFPADFCIRPASLRISTTSSRSLERPPWRACRCWPRRVSTPSLTVPRALRRMIAYHLGEAPELDAATGSRRGSNSIGIQSPRGARAWRWRNGWIDGEPTLRSRAMSTSAAPSRSRGNRPLSGRTGCRETLGLLYADHFPYRQMATARGVRRSPSAYAHLHGARRGVGRSGRVGARELVRDGRGRSATIAYSWKRQNWFDNRRGRAHGRCARAWACLDMSCFGKIRVEGPRCDGVPAAACRGQGHVRCPCRADRLHPVAEQHGAASKADVTVTRLSEAAFFLVVTAAATLQTRSGLAAQAMWAMSTW